MELTTVEGFRLSAQQEQAWLTGSLSAAPFCTTLAVLFEGQVSPAEVESAFSQVASQHEILRTIYRKQPGMKLPFQVIVEALRPGSQVCDLSRDDEMAQNVRLEALFRQEQMRTFDLSEGPVLHWVLAVLSPGSFVLIVSMPAVSADILSLRNLVCEVARTCRPAAFEDRPEAMQYVDFVQWQQELLVAKEMSAGREYWRKFPFEREPDAVWCPKGTSEIPPSGEFNPIACVAIELSSDLVSRMDEACIRCAVPTSEFLLACWSAELSRYTGNWAPTIGVGFEGRRYDELKTALGRFSAFLPLSLTADKRSTFKSYARAVRKAVAEASKWQESFALELVPGVDIDSARIVLPYLYQYEDLDGWEGGVGVRYRVLATYASGERYKLKLVGKSSVSGLRLEFHYDGLEFAAEGIGRLARNFEQLLNAAILEPERSVGELRLLGEAEREQLVLEWNRTEAVYPEECMQELIERQACCTPERAAVRCGEQGLSYRELNQRSNRLAHFLRRQGVGRGTLVGLCVERSVEMVVAVLGILKSGGAYVPLSAEHPKPRLSKQLAGVGVLISERMWSQQLPPFAGLTLWLDEEPAWSNEAETNPEAVTTAEDLAYVMYTSGSTGEPKGVEIRHRSLVNYAWFMSRLLQLEQEPEGLQFAMVSTLAADLGNTCFYPALISGGCLHVLPYAVATDGQRMASYQQQYGVDVLKIVPSHLSALLSSGEGRGILPKRYLITGGEALPRTLVEAVAASGASCRMINHYGPTETTVGSLVLPLGEYDWKRRSKGAIPLGRPIANTQVYVLDEKGNPCPIGVCGELHIGGAGVARGYLNRPELTREKFIADGFSTRLGALLYKTGDLVRYLPDGQVEFLGRMDDQVKVRGYRIEPGEIESVLLRQSEVKQAVVLAREDERQQKRLIAYVVVRNQAAVNEAELQQRIREQLPDYMVPQAVVLLDKLPLTSNGKVDRQALPKPEDVAGQKQRSYQPPTTLTQQMVAQIWSEVLKVSPIGITDDFFQLGGHSLLATQVISRIREQFGMGIALRALFEMPTLGSFAKVVEEAKGTDKPADAPIQRASREAYRTTKAVVQQ
jgi:amino acid adenylation domain-containing protein